MSIKDSEVKEIVRVEKFNGDNFHLWKFHMQFIFWGQGVTVDCGRDRDTYYNSRPSYVA